MAKHPKQVIPYAELLTKVQDVIAVNPQACRHLDVGVDVYPDQRDGANWRVVQSRRSGDDNDWIACLQAISADVRVLRETYDSEAPP